MIIARSPLRIPLGGGGTDLSSYYSTRGGALCSVAINKYTYVVIKPYFFDKLLLSYSKMENVDSAEQVQQPIIREALKMTGIKSGLEIYSIADMPSNTGLGSSSSFAVSLLHAIHTYKHEHVPLQTLAEEACDIEIKRLGEPIGKQDQYMAAFGGIVNLDISREGVVTVDPMQIQPHYLNQLEKSLFLFYTGIRRSASEVLADQDSAAKKHEAPVLETLDHLKDIGLKIRESLGKGELDRFGELMDEHWQFKKKLSSKVSSDDIDRWYEAGKSAGALGGKIMGAGGGGFLLFYCPDNAKSLRARMNEMGLAEMRFNFEYEGTKIIFNA